jgi:hypothetical protein
MNNKVIAGAIVIAVVFLIGFVPEYVKCHRLENELQACRQQNGGAQLRDLIGVTYVQASQKNFGLASETSGKFFNLAQQTAGQSGDPERRKALEGLLSMRDTVTAQLAKGDSGVIGALQQLFDKTRQATMNTANP